MTTQHPTTIIVRAFLAIPSSAMPRILAYCDDLQDCAWDVLRWYAEDGDAGVAAGERFSLRADRDGWREGREVIL
jgi:hypothetical protein